MLELSTSNQLILPPWCPPPTLVTSSGSLSIRDMNLLHHWSTITWNTVAIGDAPNRTLQTIVPQLSFENSFLLNGILGIASMDQERTSPDSKTLRNQTNIYRGKAIADFRQAVTRVVPGTRSYEASLIMSILLVVLYSEGQHMECDELIIVKWLIFYRGLRIFISMTDDFGKRVLEGGVGPFFRRELTPLKIPPVVPKLLVSMLQDVDIMDNDFLMLEYYCKVLDDLGILYASLQQDGLSPALYIRVVSWCSYVGPEFTDCAKEMRPRAIIIMAHYLVFLKIVKGLWWLQNIPDLDIGRIVTILDPVWLPYLEVPFQASLMTDKEEIAALLLR